MALISFSTYRESSPSTRNKSAAANGLAPMFSADVFGHGTPPPDIADKLLKKLEEKPKKKKKKKEEEDPVSEGKGQSPNYSFDNFIKKAASTSKEVEKELEDGKKEFDKIDKMKEKKKEEKKSIFPKKMIQASPFPKNKDDFKDKEEIPGEKLPSKDKDDDDESEDKDLKDVKESNEWF